MQVLPSYGGEAVAIKTKDILTKFKEQFLWQPDGLLVLSISRYQDDCHCKPGQIVTYCRHKIDTIRSNTTSSGHVHFMLKKRVKIY